MKSGFANTKGLSGLAGATPNNLISTTYNQLRIVGRNPASGRPAPGVPFSLNVEVTSSTAEEAFDLVCPNEFVVIRDSDTRRVWASQLIITGLLEGCTGRGVMVFDTDFVPDKNHPVVFEMYDDDEVTSLADTQNYEPDAVSRAVNFALDLNTGRGSGVYDTPNEPFYNRDGGFFDDAQKILKYTAILMGAGAGIYFLAPFAPAVKDGFEHIADKFTDKNDA